MSVFNQAITKVVSVNQPKNDFAQSFAVVGYYTGTKWGTIVRFPLNIDKGCAIGSIQIKLAAQSTRAGTCSSYVWAEANDNPAEIISVADAISRPAPAYKYDYALPTTTLNAQSTLTINKQVLQDIIDRPNWVSGNYVNIFIEDFAGRNIGSTNVRTYTFVSALNTVSIVYYTPDEMKIAHGTLDPLSATNETLSQMFYFSGDKNNDSTISSVRIKESSSQDWITVSPSITKYIELRFRIVISGLNPGTSYDIEATQYDPDGSLSGTATQTITMVTTNTKTEPISIIATDITDTTANVTATCNGDTDNDNYLNINIKKNIDAEWTPLVVSLQTTNSYSIAVTDLIQNTLYDLEANYQDVDGIINTNLIYSQFMTTSNELIVGEPIVSNITDNDALLTIPFSGDSNNDYTAKVSIKIGNGEFSIPVLMNKADNLFTAQLNWENPGSIVTYHVDFINGLGVTTSVVENSFTATLRKTQLGDLSVISKTDTSAVLNFDYLADTNVDNYAEIRYRETDGNFGAYIRMLDDHVSVQNKAYIELTGLKRGKSYFAEVLFYDRDGVIGTNPATIQFTTGFAALEVSSIDIVHGVDYFDFDILVGFSDDDLDAIATVRYQMSAYNNKPVGEWSEPQELTRDGLHYIGSVFGLVSGIRYNVEFTFSDGSGVLYNNVLNTLPLTVKYEVLTEYIKRDKEVVVATLDEVLTGNVNSIFEKWSFDILDFNLDKVGELNSVLDCNVNYNGGDSIKNTMDLRIGSLDSVDWLHSFIRPCRHIKMPDGSWDTKYFGVYYCSSPQRSFSNNVTTWNTTGYDRIIFVRNRRLHKDYALGAGTNVTLFVKDILTTDLALKDVWIDNSSKTLQVAREWSSGTTYIEMINELLDAVGYTDLYTDSLGRIRSVEYKLPIDRPKMYTYKADKDSVIIGNDETSINFETFEVPNRVIIKVSDPELPTPYIGIAINNNVNSPLSYQNLGFYVDYEEQIGSIADAGALTTKAQRVLNEKSMVYNEVSLPTGINEFHEHQSVIDVSYPAAGISESIEKVERFEEICWEVNCVKGGTMSHTLRKVIDLNAS